MSGTSPRTGTRNLSAETLAFAALCALALSGRMRLEPYDDAYFFRRFAANFLAHGAFAWNVAEGPVHGNTSQLYQLVSVPLVLAAGPYWVAAARALLTLCLCAAAYGVARSARAAGDSAPVWLLFASPVALATPFSGMETALCLLACALFLLAASRDEASDRDALVAALAVVAYLARPDTLLLTAPTLVAARGPRGALRPLAMGGAGVALVLLACRAYYGTALPLAFYLKTGQRGPYDPAFVAHSLTSKRENLVLLALVAFPSLFVCAHALERRALALLAAAGAFVAFHAFTTVEVMGMHARFYAPALPWLALAAAHAYPRYLLRARPVAVAAVLAALAVSSFLAYRFALVPTENGWPIGRGAPETYAAWVLGAAILLWPARIAGRFRTGFALGAIAFGLTWAYPPKSLAWPTDREYLRSSEAHVTSYAGLDRLLRCLGGDIHLYHSEVGLPGLVFPQGRVTDLGGLMTPSVALGLEGFEDGCKRDRPEAIFLPHRNYRALNRTILAGACIRSYTQVTRRSSSPLFIRNDLVPRYRCAREETR